MDIKQLKIFLVVSELASFTKAAKKLNYSQSTISENIIKLESDLGVKLFDRINRKISLTLKGRELLEYARKIVDLSDEAYQVISDVDEACGTITIGITESLCSYKFPDFFKSYLDKYSKVNLCFKIARCEELAPMIEKKEIDLAFTLDEDKEFYNIESIELFEEEIVFIGSVNSPLASNKKLCYSNFDMQKIVLSQGITGYNKMMKDLYKKEKIKEGSILFMESLEGIKSYVRYGFGISFIPMTAIEKELLNNELALLRVDDEKFYHKVKILIHKKKYRDMALSTLIDEAIEIYKK